ncbi:MAG: 1-deoxy-D-xylulose-5-phosphate reductoisomerase [Syntrophomonadaceae bacterium]|nr:1-deoxy-D-xylulose-5-phosphate reductoisomerase [Syntrophomonadaceae bacterium]
MINIVILGSTGSIGLQALDVIARHNERFRVVGLAARNEVDVLKEQAEQFKPKAIAVGDNNAYPALKNSIAGNVELLSGMEGLSAIAAWPDADIILVAVSGAIGILPTLSAIKAKKQIALANKETLVTAGDLVMQEIKNNNINLIPVDSEHSAIFQCLAGEKDNLKKIWLTASGGPFRDFTLQELELVNVEMALCHPNWSMGPKITIDSATLMNKGLEVIEAHHLFGVDYNDIGVLIHPQSIVHSMVELVDGAFLAHLGAADMRIPIQYAFTYPDRLPSSAQYLDFTKLAALEFQAPDIKRFPALELAYEAGRTGGTMPAVLNAANEIAVQYFLGGKIGFTLIPRLVEQVMNRHDTISEPNLEEILSVDKWARILTEDIINRGGSS